MNKMIIMGRLTKDPELRTASTGMPVAAMTVAVDRRKKQDGTRETDFFSVKAFGRLAEICAENFQKGGQVLSTGRMESGSYEKDGQKRTYWEMILEEFDFLHSRESALAPGMTANSACIPAAVPDEDLPF